MPRTRGTPATQEEYEEWLGRLEEEAPLPDDYETFVKVLSGELRMPDGSTLNYNDAQIETLWELKQGDVEYDEHGVTAVLVRYPWGAEMRYGIQGLSGLFGWERLQEIRAEEEW